MESILLITKDKKNEEKITHALYNTYKISPPDVYTVISDRPSIGIDDIRSIQETVYRHPLKGSLKAIVIPNAHQLTIQAQNALLKILEEPPAHVVFILITNNRDSLLSTIISRCKILQDNQIETRLEENFEPTFLTTVHNQSLATIFFLAQKKAKTREDALAFLEKTIHFLHQEMKIKTMQNLHSEQITKIQETYRLISNTNVSPRFAIEILLLSLL